MSFSTLLIIVSMSSIALVLSSVCQFAESYPLEIPAFSSLCPVVRVQHIVDERMCAAKLFSSYMPIYEVFDFAVFLSSDALVVVALVLSVS